MESDDVEEAFEKDDEVDRDLSSRDLSLCDDEDDVKATSGRLESSFYF